jgi:hypothetical protein
MRSVTCRFRLHSRFRRTKHHRHNPFPNSHFLSPFCREFQNHESQESTGWIRHSEASFIREICAIRGSFLPSG